MVTYNRLKRILNSKRVIAYDFEKDSEQTAFAKDFEEELRKIAKTYHNNNNSIDNSMLTNKVVNWIIHEFKEDLDAALKANKKFKYKPKDYFDKLTYFNTFELGDTRDEADEATNEIDSDYKWLLIDYEDAFTIYLDDYRERYWIDTALGEI